MADSNSARLWWISKSIVPISIEYGMRQGEELLGLCWHYEVLCCVALGCWFFGEFIHRAWCTVLILEYTKVADSTRSALGCSSVTGRLVLCHKIELREVWHLLVMRQRGWCRINLGDIYQPLLWYPWGSTKDPAFLLQPSTIPAAD